MRIDIGEKIRALRIAKKITQNELAGDKITRNMLSRIENGAALPSVPTVIYLAEKLGVPAGYLLAEEDNEFFYRKMNSMASIKAAFSSSEWHTCRELCLSLGGFDDETVALIVFSSFNMAKECFACGKLKDSVLLFFDVIERIEGTMYPLSELKDISLVYLAYMKDISSLVFSEAFDGINEIPNTALGDQFCRYCAALNYIKQDNAASTLLPPMPDNEPLCDHIRAKLAIKRGKAQEAYTILKRLIDNKARLPMPILFNIFSDLEDCCSTMADYRGAYEYSNCKLRIAENFIK